MSLETSRKCVACKAYLFEDDDTVFCPVCGAPHHRECYAALGHCACEEQHGTDEQYREAPMPESAEQNSEGSGNSAFVTCRMCGEKYDRDERSCPTCSTPNMETLGGGVMFDFLGGVPGDLDVGEGITAEESKRYVIANTPRYIPKFAAMKVGHKLSWNWLAFLLPCGWFCARKMYRNGFIVGLLNVAFGLLTLPMSLAASTVLEKNGTPNMSSVQLAQVLSEHLSAIGTVALLLGFSGVILNFALRICAGLFGDYFYYRHTLSKVAWIRAESEDADMDYRRLGGISLLGLLIGTFAVQWAPILLEKLIL